MIGYKFLRAGGVGAFSGLSWPLPTDKLPGAWVTARGRLRESLNGIHGCRTSDLPDWLDDELWTLELDGQIVEGETTVVGRRGRLLARVAAWTDATAQDFTAACVRRARDRAVEALRQEGFRSEADELGAAEEVEAVRAVGTAQAARLESTAAAALLAFALDTTALARGQRPDAWRLPDAPAPSRPNPATIAANLGFVLTHGAGLAATARGDLYATGVTDERAWQVGWLVKRLQLNHSVR